MATAVACLPDADAANPIPPLTPYFVMRVGRRMPVVPLLPPGRCGDGAGDRRRRRGMRARCCWPITGRWSSGKTLTDAVYAAEEMEEAAKLFLMLRGARARC